jgi:hypothetical protein
LSDFVSDSADVHDSDFASPPPPPAETPRPAPADDRVFGRARSHATAWKDFVSNDLWVVSSDVEDGQGGRAKHGGAARPVDARRKRREPEPPAKAEEPRITRASPEGAKAKRSRPKEEGEPPKPPKIHESEAAKPKRARPREKGEDDPNRHRQRPPRPEEERRRRPPELAPVPPRRQYADENDVLAQFSFNHAFNEGDLFPSPPAPPVTPDIIAQHAAMDALFADPFPIRRIVGMQKDRDFISLACELPDEPEVVMLPLVLLEIVQPELVADFLASHVETLDST